MSYFVTGATGFIGRHLVAELLKREGNIYALVREGSRGKLDALAQRVERIAAFPQPRDDPRVGDGRGRPLAVPVHLRDHALAGPAPQRRGRHAHALGRLLQ